MRSTAYIETTIVSYLTARPTRDLIRTAQQRTTQEWWNSERERFDLFCSELVILECAAGDSDAAAERLKAVAKIPLLDLTPSATQLADSLISAGAIPQKAFRDALHIGICAVHNVSFLLTWNFRHLANARMQDKIREVCLSEALSAPVICSPDALFEEES